MIQILNSEVLDLMMAWQLKVSDDSIPAWLSYYNSIVDCLFLWLTC